MLRRASRRALSAVFLFIPVGQDRYGRPPKAPLSAQENVASMRRLIDTPAQKIRASSMATTAANIRGEREGAMRRWLLRSAAGATAAFQHLIIMVNT
jgi:hypothetical protein